VYIRIVMLLMSHHTTDMYTLIFLIAACVNASSVSNEQVASLRDIYDSAGGESWQWRQADGSRPIWNFTGPLDSIDPCNDNGEVWQGLECSHPPMFCASTPCDVTVLTLGGYGLNGTIPSSLSSLSSLSMLDLSTIPLADLLNSTDDAIFNTSSNKSCNIYGTLPQSVGDMVDLKILNLARCRLSGSLPRSFGNLTKLDTVFLNSNNFGGSLPTELSALEKVRVFNVGSNMLMGSIFSEVGNLKQLEYLFLNDNFLQGPIPSELGLASSLVRVVISNNEIYSSIPSALGLLTGLQSLECSRAHLTGVIPSELGNLSSLVLLDMHTNELSGILPYELCQLVNLEALKARNNMIHGTIPECFGNLRNLEALDLASNTFNGTVPASVGNITTLQTINLFQNEFSGFIPAKVENLTMLRFLSLASNEFSGVIPSYLGTLPNLQYIFIENNRMTGSIPSELGLSNSLIHLSMNRNNLFGTIPRSLGMLTKLRNLNVMACSLTGTIPPELGNLSSLITLDFHENSLTGTLPSELGLLTRLGFAFLSKNNFTGTLPSTLHSPWMEFLDVGHNLLTGSLPLTLFNQSKLKGLDVAHNMLTSTLPSEFKNLKLLRNIYLEANAFTGSLPLEWSDISRLNYLNLHNNFLDGSIPNEYLKLTELEEIFLYENYLTGTIPSQIGLLSLLLNIDVHSNSLSGTIPTSFGDMASLYYLQFHDNFLSGNIPSSLSKLSSLLVLELQGNELTGRLGHVFSNEKDMSIENLDLSDNFLSGRIPDGLFDIPHLRTVALSSNCFYNTLPNRICNARSLSVVSFDGLGSADKCSDGFTVPFTKVTLRPTVDGTLPQCLFSLENLTVLHIAGNKLSGTISDIPPESKLYDLSLAHNHLSGTIPVSIQRKKFDNLDLSYNKFGGLCSYLLTSDGAKIALEVNRLSGNFPSRLSHARGLNVLSDNIFSCGDLPRYDKNFDEYSCGSRQLNRSLYMLCAVIGFFALFVAYCVCILYYGNKTRRLLDHSVKTSVQSFVLTSSEIMTKIQAFFFYIDFLPDASFPHIRYFYRLMTGIRNGVVILSCLGVIFCMPIYVQKVLDDGLEDGKYSTRTEMYMWLLSTTFVTGQAPCAILFSAWIVCICTFVYGFHYWKRIHRVSVPLPPKLGPTSSDSHIGPNLSRQLFVTALMAAVNVVVVVFVNVIYIYSTFVTLSDNKKLLAQFSLAIFKYVWNFIIVPALFARHLLNPAYRSRLKLCILIFNSMLIPCFVTLFTSPSCYRGLLEEQKSIRSEYDYFLCDNHREGHIFDFCTQFTLVHVEVVPVTPPFTYNYECTSALLKSYIPVFIYTYCFQFILPPFVLWILTKLSYLRLPEFLRFAMFGVLWPNHWSSDSDGIVERQSTPHKLFKLDSVLTMIMHHIVILLTFGLTSPFLATAIVATVGSMSVQHRLLVGRFVLTRLSTSRRDSAILRRFDSRIRESDVFTSVFRPSFACPSVGRDCTDIALVTLEKTLSTTVPILECCMWPVVIGTSVFFVFICWDMAGDEVGWRHSTWVPCVVISVPFMIWATRWLIQWSFALGIRTRAEDIPNVEHTLDDKNMAMSPNGNITRQQSIKGVKNILEMNEIYDRDSGKCSLTTGTESPIHSRVYSDINL